jgi:hypothetical protein
LVVSAASFRKKVAYFAISATILGGAAVWLNLPGMLVGYFNGYQLVEHNVAALGRDPNAVLGRVAALYIVPRMISAHPITGVGIGNYPLMRNDPRYLGNLPTMTDVEDLPAIGIPGTAAEIGIPATVWLMILLLAPYWVCRKKASIIGTVALFQFLAHAFSVQLTFFYPWFISACAFAASSYERTRYSLSFQRQPLHVLSHPMAHVVEFYLRSRRVCYVAVRDLLLSQLLSPRISNRHLALTAISFLRSAKHDYAPFLQERVECSCGGP